MNCIEFASRRAEIFGDERSSDGNVRRLRTSGGVLYRIEARVLPFLTGCVYLIGDPDSASNADATPAEYLAVDAGSGSDESNADLENGLRTIRQEFDSTFAPEKIRRIVLTHAHVDHFGGANYWRRRTNAEIWLHAFESRIVESFNEEASVSNCRFAFFLREAGATETEIPKILEGFGFLPGRAKSAPIARTLFGGEKIGKIRFFYLPGHSPGHLALQFDDVVLSGDLLLSKTLTQIWPAGMTPQTGLLNYVWSLKRLEKIAVDFERVAGKKLVAFPAHEEPIFDVPNRVGQALRGMERRNRRLFELLGRSEKPLSLFEIARRMYWSGRPNREFFALADVGSRVELLRQLGLLAVANYDELSETNPTLRYANSFSDAKLAENTIEQVVRMRLSGNESESFEGDSNFCGD